jgi:hypothetical protein
MAEDRVAWQEMCLTPEKVERIGSRKAAVLLDAVYVHWLSGVIRSRARPVLVTL